MNQHETTFFISNLIGYYIYMYIHNVLSVFLIQIIVWLESCVYTYIRINQVFLLFKTKNLLLY